MPDMGHYVQTKIFYEWTTEACQKIFYSFSIQRRHTVWDKKNRKKRQNVPDNGQHDIDIFLIPWRSTNHRNVQEKHQKLLACHIFLSLPRWPNHTPTVYTDKRNFSKSWLTELDIPKLIVFLKQSEPVSESKSKTSLYGRKFATTARPYKKTNRNILTLSPSTCMIFFDPIVEKVM